ncbi:MAG: methylated-DNA--[protein]-cysteine S-methyltransferase, partial [Parachlamydiales bacterium]|nr:methylated-DNA--[protein]-cysteine S-methyltransferase [Parachlamydiales bacterium]
YESGSGFKDAFTKILGEAPIRTKYCNLLKSAWIDSKLGPVLAISDDKFLYLLEFVERRGLESEIERLRIKMRSNIIPGRTDPIDFIEKELRLYFDGKLQDFKTPIKVMGSAFQQTVWNELQKIPYGQTRSYADIAKSIGRPTAFRAVAQANGTNQLAIIIPCHRVINSNGGLGGYAGKIVRKKWMLDFEKTNLIKN